MNFGWLELLGDVLKDSGKDIGGSQGDPGGVLGDGPLGFGVTNLEGKK